MRYPSQVVCYREIPPSPLLRHVVSTFWLLELDASDAPTQRIVPDGRCELIVNWAEPLAALNAGQAIRQPQCFFAGQIDGPLLLKSLGRTKILGIGFHPHGASAVLQPPMHELSSRFTPIDEISRPLAHGLARAIESADPIRAVESALLSALGRSRPTDALVSEAVRRIGLAPAHADIAALAHDFNLSTRQLERRFRQAVGLSPKLFAEIQRFNRVFQPLEDGSRDWVTTALACGYYDQAHLIRDCKRFSGTTPARLLSDDGDLARHFYQRAAGMSHSSNTALRASV